MKTLTIKFDNGQSMTLQPMPMVRMPSENFSDWRAFQGHFVPGTEMSETEQDRVVQFMNECKTEALTNGTNIYTFVGGLLANCDPSAIK